MPANLLPILGLGGMQQNFTEEELRKALEELLGQMPQTRSPDIADITGTQPELIAPVLQADQRKNQIESMLNATSQVPVVGGETGQKPSKWSAIGEILKIALPTVAGAVTQGGKGALTGLAGAGMTEMNQQAMARARQSELFKQLMEMQKFNQTSEIAAGRNAATTGAAKIGAESREKVAGIQGQNQKDVAAYNAGAAAAREAMRQAGASAEAQANFDRLYKQIIEVKSPQGEVLYQGPPAAAGPAVTGMLAGDRAMKQQEFQAGENEKDRAIQWDRLQLDRQKYNAETATKAKEQATKPLSGEAAKLKSMAQTMIPEITALKKAIADDYTGFLKGYLLGSDRRIVKLVDQVADKVGRFRSGGAINKDEENRFKRQIVSSLDLLYGKKEDAIAALDGLMNEATIVLNSVEPATADRLKKLGDIIK